MSASAGEVDVASGGFEATLTGLAERYQDNREQLDGYICDFKVTVGFCRSEEDAIAGGALDEAVTAVGVWVVNGDNSRYELRLDSSNIEKRMKEADASGSNRVVWPFPEMVFLSNRELQFTYSPQLNLGVVGRPDGNNGPFVTPIDMGVMGQFEALNPAQRIRECSGGDKGRCKLVARGPADRDGIVSVEFSQPAATAEEDGGTTVIWFDTKKGSFPVRCDMGPTGKPVRLRTIVTEMIECSQSRWFPKRSVQVGSPDRADGQRVPVREIVVTRLELDHEPTREQLTVRIPNGIAIQDAAVLGSQFVAGNEFELDPSRLDSLFALSAKAVDANARRGENVEAVGAEMEAGLSGAKWMAILNVFFIPLLVCGIALSWWRARKQ